MHFKSGKDVIKRRKIARLGWHATVRSRHDDQLSQHLITSLMCSVSFHTPGGKKFNSKSLSGLAEGGRRGREGVWNLLVLGVRSGEAGWGPGDKFHPPPTRGTRPVSITRPSKPQGVSMGSGLVQVGDSMRSQLVPMLILPSQALVVG